MQPVYLFGATRSGTTWLQNMLGSQPEIVTPQELDLFSSYVAGLHERWRDHLPESEEEWQRHRHKGLPSVFTEDAFIELVRDLVERVYSEVLACKPSASVVLEKVPGYTEYTDLIYRHFPEARFIHLVRDGRDVAASLARASRGWGRDWAVSSAHRAASIWRANIERGRNASTLGAPYLELRYEELRSPDGPAALERAFAFCGVDVDHEQCTLIHARFSLDARSGVAPPSSIVWGGEVRRRLGTSPSEPKGFFGEGRVGSWRTELGPYDRWIFERVAGDLLRELGYEDGRDWVASDMLTRVVAPARLALGNVVRRTRFASGAARAVFRERGRNPFGTVSPHTRSAGE